jgi:hypothetical protein
MLLLTAIVVSFTSIIYAIDQKDISPVDSEFTINSSYYIDESNQAKIGDIITRAPFI